MLRIPQAGGGVSGPIDFRNLKQPLGPTANILPFRGQISPQTNAPAPSQYQTPSTWGQGPATNPDGTPKRDFYGLNPIDMGKQEGFNMWRNLATQKGPSQFTQFGMQQNLQNRKQSIDAAGRQQAGALQGAYSQLASRGGIGGGSRERLAQSGMNDQMMAKQGAYQTAGNNLLDLLKQDQSQKTEALGKFSGMETDLSKYNLDLGKELYGIDNARWAAEQQAKAIRDAAAAQGGGKGGGGLDFGLGGIGLPSGNPLSWVVNPTKNIIDGIGNAIGIKF